MTTLAKSHVVRARIEPKVKRDAESILKRYGVSHSTLINMSYRAVVEDKGIPLSLCVANAETAKVLRAARKAAKRKRYAAAETAAEFNALMKSSRQAMRRIAFGVALKKDHKRMVRRGARLEKLDAVLGLLIADTPLPLRNRPHLLSGEWKGFWECHIEPDWLLSTI